MGAEVEGSPKQDSITASTNMEPSADVSQKIDEISSHHSESTRAPVIRLIDEAKLQMYALTKAQCDEILRLRGIKPGLDDLLKDIRDQVEIKIRRFRTWLDEVSLRIFEYACTATWLVEGAESEHVMKPQLREWYIANSLPETKRLFLELLTDQRIIRGSVCTRTLHLGC